MKNVKSKKLRIKKSKIYRNFYIFIVCVFILIMIFICIDINILSPRRLEVDYLDVGQGDSEIIKTPGHKIILIDGGPDNLVLRRLGEVLPFYKRQIDLVILSHFHEDHITGLIEIFQRYKVKRFIYINNYQSPLLDELLLISKSKGTNVVLLKNSANISLEQDCLLKIINPNIFNIKEDQNNSIISKLDCRKNQFLFSGDNSTVVERALVNSGFDLQALVLKASHHGSNTANSEQFLRAVNPKDFIISDGINNKFKHPNPEIIERASRLNFNIFRTDKQGTIRIFGQF